MAILIPSSKARKERVYQLIEGQIELGTLQQACEGIVKVTAVAAPQAYELETPWRRSALLASILAVLGVAFAQSMAPSSRLLVASVGLCAVLHTFALIVQQRRRAGTVGQDIYQALKEMQDIRDNLNTYLNELDTRTRKYFHCVTNTKVTTYCILRQLLLSLDERIGIVESLLRSPNGQDLADAHRELARDLVFRDGFLKSSGKERYIAPQRIIPVIEGLTRELEDSLKELEDEISFSIPRTPVPHAH